MGAFWPRADSFPLVRAGVGGGNRAPTLCGEPGQRGGAVELPHHRRSDPFYAGPALGRGGQPRAERAGAAETCPDRAGQVRETGGRQRTPARRSRSLASCQAGRRAQAPTCPARRQGSSRQAESRPLASRHGRKKGSKHCLTCASSGIAAATKRRRSFIRREDVDEGSIASSTGSARRRGSASAARQSTRTRFTSSSSTIPTSSSTGRRILKTTV